MMMFSLFSLSAKFASRAVPATETQPVFTQQEEVSLLSYRLQEYVPEKMESAQETIASKYSNRKYCSIIAGSLDEKVHNWIIHHERHYSGRKNMETIRLLIQIV
jgi:hypothetical protein